MRFAGAGPLAIFSDCHAQTLVKCLRLQALAGQSARSVEGRWSDELQQTSQGILDHFDGDALRNHEEEEACLFPALIESMAGSDAVCLHEMTEGLTSQHRQLERNWLRLRGALAAIAAGHAVALDAQDVQAFVDANLRHIEDEEVELLPMASRLIAGTELPGLRTAVLERRRAR